MTTMTANTYDAKTLSQMTVGHANYLKKWANSNGYSFEGEIFSPEEIESALRNASKRTLKRINAMIRQRPTLRSANIFFHFISKRTGSPLIKVSLSEKENAIVQARKAWKSQQALADKLLKEYKALKGDFYKKDRVSL
jgi:hypothetical protein